MALKVKCLSRCKALDTEMYLKDQSYKPTVIYYSLVDLQGNRRDLRYEELKEAIEKGILDCVNVYITEEGLLWFEMEPGEDEFPPTDVEAYKNYSNRCKIMGIEEDASYYVRDGHVVLFGIRQAPDGVYEIPSFVSGIDCSPVMGIIHSDTQRLKVINRHNRIRNMECMFACAHNLSELDLSEFSTTGAISMACMFNCDKELRHLDLRTFDTSCVVNMDGMFARCEHLVDVNLKSFRTSNVLEMRTMFKGCKALETVDLSTFDTSRVITFDSMFADCASLRDLDISHFRTDNVTRIANMFSGCDSLRSLNLTNFDVSKTMDNSHFISNGLYNRSKLNDSIRRWGRKEWLL